VAAQERVEEQVLPQRGLARRPIVAEALRAIVAGGIVEDSLAPKPLSPPVRELAPLPIAMAASSQDRPIVAPVETFAAQRLARFPIVAVAQYSARFPIVVGAHHLVEVQRLARFPIAVGVQRLARFPIAVVEAHHLVEVQRLARFPIAVVEAPERSNPTLTDRYDTMALHNSAYRQQAAIPALPRLDILAPRPLQALLLAERGLNCSP
jgi:hypothetical protein